MVKSVQLSSISWSRTSEVWNCRRFCGLSILKCRTVVDFVVSVVCSVELSSISSYRTSEVWNHRRFCGLCRPKCGTWISVLWKVWNMKLSPVSWFHRSWMWNCCRFHGHKGLKYETVVCFLVSQVRCCEIFGGLTGQMWNCRRLYSLTFPRYALESIRGF